MNAVIDCGADTCVTDAQLRKVLGRDGLPPARGLLQGVGGFDANRNRDILRIVDGGGKVSVTDVREVETLGNSPPDGPKYQQGVMAEFTITPGDPIISLGTHGSQTRLLIGLKTGDLLGRKLSQEEIISRGLSVPIFSPNLQIWCTKLNDNLVFSGCIGINPSVIDKRNDFPRFFVVVPENLSNNQIIE